MDWSPGEVSLVWRVWVEDINRTERKIVVFDKGVVFAIVSNTNRLSQVKQNLKGSSWVRHTKRLHL